MYLTFDPEETIGHIQDAFHADFPYLKIAFFTKDHAESEGNVAKFMISDRAVKLADMPNFKHDGTIKVEKNLTAGKFESQVLSQTGLTVQVFKKSGNQWLETTHSDHLTLAEINEKAREYAEYQSPSEDPADYRDMD